MLMLMLASRTHRQDRSSLRGRGLIGDWLQRHHDSRSEPADYRRKERTHLATKTKYSCQKVKLNHNQRASNSLFISRMWKREAAEVTSCLKVITGDEGHGQKSRNTTKLLQDKLVMVSFSRSLAQNQHKNNNIKHKNNIWLSWYIPEGGRLTANS